MANFIESMLDSVDVFLSWMSSGLLKQTNESYCEIQTADSPTVLVANDGSLVSVLRIDGVKALIGNEEFERIQNGLLQGLQSTMRRTGHAIQVYFKYDKGEVGEDIAEIFSPARETAKRVGLELTDLFNERINYLSGYYLGYHFFWLFFYLHSARRIFY